MTAKLEDRDYDSIHTALRTEGLRLRSGPFTFCIRSAFPSVAHGLQQLYPFHPIVGSEDFIDFYVDIARPQGLRRYIRPQASFLIDEVAPFKPLPAAQAFPMLEWGLNWCITAYCHHYLILHAACVEKNGRAAILPAPPGSGKSTLCAALVNRGWRLLSDELTIICPNTGKILPLARPVNLKNASIDIIRTFAPTAFFSPPVLDTTKGTVALMRPPADSVLRMNESVQARWVVLPRYRPDTPARLAELGNGQTFMHLADNAMNYHILGERGFRQLGGLIDACSGYTFEYSQLEDAMRIFDELAHHA